MSISGEYAIQGAVQCIVESIKQEIIINCNNYDTVKSLQKIGLVALDQFDWTIPDWSHEYFKLFRE